MKPIIQLDRHLINKIAAGEVVERPVSVVKELVENAIDAHATMITVEIADGGLSFVRITDNGVGIPSGQMELAFARHATSKISTSDDLFTVGTLGFRGEALSSISSVSHVEMISKPNTQDMGQKIEIHGGQLVESTQVGCSDGTSIIVRNLFFNTPARLKFLKKPSSEAGLISDCLKRLALSYPELTIRYINNNQTIFETTGSNNLQTTILGIYGREIATKIIPVDIDTGELRLSGVVGKPEISRANRQYESFFINRRYVISKLLTEAAETAMKTIIPAGRFPFYVLNLTIDPAMLDVNVHPTKMDVRFADENVVFKFVEEVIREVMEGGNLIPTMRNTGHDKRDALNVRPYETEIYGLTKTESWVDGLVEDTIDENDFPIMKINYQTENETENIETRAADFLPYEIKNVGANSVRPLMPEVATPTKAFFTDYKILGLVSETFWAVSAGESLYLIDQHAAHERILYENLLKKTKDLSVQSLLNPIELHLTPHEQILLEENLRLFSDFGFDIIFRQGSTYLTTVPMLIKGPVSPSFFTDLLDKISNLDFNRENIYNSKREIIAMSACKAAVKAGEELSVEEARSLIIKLLALDNPFTCPHGRPTIIEITKHEIESRFKRT